MRGNRVLSRVNELIDPYLGEWDEDLIRENFWPIDADRILQIPLYRQGTEDYIAWHLTKNGVFSVRSAYYKQWEETYVTASGSVGYGGSSSHPVWKSLWNLKLPGKVKIFLWRCLHNAIPCLSVLANRHIGNNSQYPVCSSGAEDIMHALFNCPRARAIREALGVGKEMQNAVLVDRAGSAVIEFFLCDKSFQRPFMEPVQIPELLATACWFIWWQRRQLVRGEPVQNSEQTALSLHALTLNFVKARGKVAQPQRINKWRPSLEGQLILNVDASFSELDYTGASGAVIRDNRGRFIKAATARLYHVPDVVSAEAAALLEGLKLLRSTGCNNAVIRMDG